MVLVVQANRTKRPKEEAKIPEFFLKRGMVPIRDRLSDNGGVNNATRTFHYLLPDDPDTIARLCASVFQDIFQVTDEHGLKFSTHGL
jgi:hypothetical protein